MPKKKKPTGKTKARTGQSQTKRAGPRLLEQPKRIWYKPLSWRHRPAVPTYKPLPKARLLFVAAIRQIWANKIAFGGIIMMYGLLHMLLVQGFGNAGDLTTLKQTLNELFSGFGGQLFSATTTFTFLLTTSGTGDAATSGVYQMVLLIVCSLAYIWALRQTTAGHSVRIRDGFYNGMYPLIPFLLIFLLLSLQLLPLLAGGALYT